MCWILLDVGTYIEIRCLFNVRGYNSFDRSPLIGEFDLFVIFDSSSANFNTKEKNAAFVGMYYYIYGWCMRYIIIHYCPNFNKRKMGKYISPARSQLYDLFRLINNNTHYWNIYDAKSTIIGRLFSFKPVMVETIFNVFNKTFTMLKAFIQLNIPLTRF